MRRGTTPTLEIKSNGVQLSDLSTIYITLKQHKKEISKTGDDIRISGDTLLVDLSQEDTLALDKGYVWIQMRAMTLDGKAIASKIEMIPVEDILKEGVVL